MQSRLCEGQQKRTKRQAPCSSRHIASLIADLAAVVPLPLFFTSLELLHFLYAQRIFATEFLPRRGPRLPRHAIAGEGNCKTNVFFSLG